jgi:hypothetical protein
MTVKLTMDIFSGQPNPTVELDGPESQEVLERLTPVRRLEEGEPDLPPEPRLGYRGVVVELTGEEAATYDLPLHFRVAGADVFGRGLAHRARDAEIEQFLVAPDGPFRRVGLEPQIFERLPREIELFRQWRLKWPIEIVWPIWPWTRCACAPRYEPAWWNVPSRQPFNNCYNYATNYRTDTFAQPGRAAGQQYASLSCPDVLAGAVADALIDVPGADNTCPAEGQLVALVVAPGWDFHWYRKGRNGRWTHKPGSTPVTAVDNSGQVIIDPRNADRGPYTDFCTFMVVLHGHIKIS